ncbi:hypothetical protein BaRGS_00021998 [Batillaria attramentaria]|uniref:Uncharacterized protein n=1 Tax=Batillaria attramentaria TaxID=370345 RepID=A0ABD0KI46_9CAEN
MTCLTPDPFTCRPESEGRLGFPALVSPLPMSVPNWSFDDLESAIEPIAGEGGGENVHRPLFFYDTKSWIHPSVRYSSLQTSIEKARSGAADPEHEKEKCRDQYHCAKLRDWDARCLPHSTSPSPPGPAQCCCLSRYIKQVTEIGNTTVTGRLTQSLRRYAGATCVMPRSVVFGPFRGKGKALFGASAGTMASGPADHLVAMDFVTQKDHVCGIKRYSRIFSATAQQLNECGLRRMDSLALLRQSYTGTTLSDDESDTESLCDQVVVSLFQSPEGRGDVHSGTSGDLSDITYGDFSDSTPPSYMDDMALEGESSGLGGKLPLGQILDSSAEGAKKDDFYVVVAACSDDEDKDRQGSANGVRDDSTGPATMETDNSSYRSLVAILDNLENPALPGCVGQSVATTVGAPLTSLPDALSSMNSFTAQPVLDNIVTQPGFFTPPRIGDTDLAPQVVTAGNLTTDASSALETSDSAFNQTNVSATDVVVPDVPEGFEEGEPVDSGASTFLSQVRFFAGRTWAVRGEKLKEAKHRKSIPDDLINTDDSDVDSSTGPRKGIPQKGRGRGPYAGSVLVKRGRGAVSRGRGLAKQVKVAAVTKSKSSTANAASAQAESESDTETRSREASPASGRQSSSRSRGMSRGRGRQTKRILTSVGRLLPGRGGKQSPGRGGKQSLGRGGKFSPGRGGKQLPARGGKASPARGGKSSPAASRSKSPKGNSSEILADTSPPMSPLHTRASKAASDLLKGRVGSGIGKKGKMTSAKKSGSSSPATRGQTGSQEFQDISLPFSPLHTRSSGTSGSKMKRTDYQEMSPPFSPLYTRSSGTASCDSGISSSSATKKHPVKKKISGGLKTGQKDSSKQSFSPGRQKRESSLTSSAGSVDSSLGISPVVKLVKLTSCDTGWQSSSPDRFATKRHYDTDDAGPSKRARTSHGLSQSQQIAGKGSGDNRPESLTKSVGDVMSYLFGENLVGQCPAGFTVNVKLEVEKKKEEETSDHNSCTNANTVVKVCKLCHVNA